jgi:hypothetical protein
MYHPVVTVRAHEVRVDMQESVADLLGSRSVRARGETSPLVWCWVAGLDAVTIRAREGRDLCAA